MRRLVAFAAGGLFGFGLMYSGMVDTARVQGWLDLFGRWDPTLAFVLGGAILPMLGAWALAARMSRPVVGECFPPRPQPVIDARLVIGSALFGAGWALAGLCPGPAVASLGFNGAGGLVFLAAMIGGMLLARRIVVTGPVAA